MNVRHVTEYDFGEITEILNHYILHSDARYFEPSPVSLSERKSWLHTFSQDTPYQMFVAADNNKILGFCCSQKYRPETAYDETVEVSIYLAPIEKSAGIGTQLYDHLFESLARYRLHRAIAGIALPNKASLAFHKKFDFVEVGTFDEYGLKDGRRISATWLQKKL